ncbi:hypothetical protein M9H77_31905 [Catharanthus roseus]|uniref:Uncharacterized protein n=1 Tax=Catharanthus roseus TaxID=4058 RepID=A0ACC0A1G8_CATRO|nr:hypothetical protein M9H77_31905 [Catharanthus roseus]
MNGANKLETTSYITKHRIEGCVKYYNPRIRYFKRRKCNRTSKEKKKTKYYKIYEEILREKEFEPIEDSEFSDIEEEESSLDEETIKEPMYMLRTYTQEEDIIQKNIQEIEDDERIVFGNLDYQKLIFTIKPIYAISLADENLDRSLNLYYQLHRIRIPRGSKAFSITTDII